MAADLHIHAIPKYWVDDYIDTVMAVFCAHHLGSKWSNFYVYYGTTEADVDARNDISPEEKEQEKANVRMDQLNDEQKELVRDLALINRKWPRAHMMMWNWAVQEIEQVDSIWIGKVSWLKAALVEGGERFIPGPVAQISDLIDESYPVLTSELADSILTALGTENMTSYETAKPDDVRPWLDSHMGMRLFTVSW
jgi:hypothetical protein